MPAATPARAPGGDSPGPGDPQQLIDASGQNRGASHPDATGQPAEDTVWADAGQLTSDWDPPRWHDRFGFGSKLGIVTLGVALLAAALFAGGAFRRESTVHPVDWRTPVVTGPVEVTFQGATYEKSSFRALITVHASCRLVHPTATRLQSQDLRKGISARIAPGQLVAFKDRYAEFANAGTWALSRDELSPGVGQVPCRLQLTVPDSYLPQSHVQLFVFTQTWSDRDAAQTGGPGWRVSRGGVTMAVPVVAVAEPAR